MPQDEDEPKIVHETLSCLTKDKWLKVMKEEIESMRSNNVWELVNLLKECKAIGDK